MTESSQRAARDIHVVTAADDGYAMPLAVTIRSALDRLAPDRRLRLMLLDGGLSDANRRRLEASWRDPRLTLQWFRPDVTLVRDLPVSDHISPAAYLRLLMPAMLPRDVSRVIYLDADMLVRRCLGDLWDLPQHGSPALAVQDFAAPYLDAASMMPNYARSQRFLAAYTPVANFRELGLPADGMYFNSGLMVIDLDQWRCDHYADHVLDCLRVHREHVLWWDQYALNVVLAGKWRPLDRRWNQGAHIYAYPSWRESPFERDEFQRLRTEPWIVHYCSPTKPWQYFCRHPHVRQFYRTLDRTAWRSWRPDRPERFLKLWWDFHYKPRRLRMKTRLRLARERLSGLAGLRRAG